MNMSPKQGEKVRILLLWEKIAALKEMLGIHSRISDEQKAQMDEYDLDENGEYVNKNLEKAVVRAVEEYGWSRKRAARRIAETKRRLGITYIDYCKYDFYKFSKRKQAAAYQKIREEKQRKAEVRKEVVQRVMEITGWKYAYAQRQIQEAQKRTGCTYTEYLIYKFYDMTPAEQDDIFLISFSKKITDKYDTDKKFRGMLCNKAATNRFFSECLARPWCVNTNVSFSKFCTVFTGCDKIFYKPMSLNGGRGAASFELTQENLREVYDTLRTYPRGVVEGYVIQHPKMNALSPTAVNTVRIVTISSREEPIATNGKMMDIPYVALKMGGADSLVDNLHGGGMVAAVDKETGVLITDAVDGMGNVYTQHPVTGTTIKGFEIPFFRESIEMVTRAIEEKNLVGYLGWDIAITEDGPTLIETNTTPGVILLTMPYIAQKKGMKPLMAQYL